VSAPLDRCIELKLHTAHASGAFIVHIANGDSVHKFVRSLHVQVKSPAIQFHPSCKLNVDLVLTIGNGDTDNYVLLEQKVSVAFQSHHFFPGWALICT
jgi:hypothetical protein